MTTPDRCARCDCGDEIAALKERAERAEGERNQALGDLKAEVVANQIARAELEAARDEDQEAHRLMMAERDSLRDAFMDASKEREALLERVRVTEANYATRNSDCGDLAEKVNYLRAEVERLKDEVLNAKSELDCGSKRAECPCAACAERGLRARVAELESGVEDFAKVAEQSGQSGTAIGLRTLLSKDKA